MDRRVARRLMSTLTLFPRVLHVIIENYALANNYLQELLSNTHETSRGSIIWLPTSATLNFGDFHKFKCNSYRFNSPKWDISKFSGTVVGKIPRRYIYSLIECDYK